MHYITFRRQKQILYGCLVLVLLTGLLLQVCAGRLGPDLWNDAWLFASPGWRWIHRRRCCRHRSLGWAFVARRGWVLLCRLGLVAGLLLWSGWPQRQPVSWLVLSVPLVDGLLSMLPLLWPGVLKLRAYPDVMRGVNTVYRFTLVVLVYAGLVLRQDSSSGLLLVGGSVKSADGAWARAEIEADGTWRLEMEGSFIFSYKPRNAFEERVLLILFRHFRTPASTPQRPFLRQEWLAEWFAVHQELISRWQAYVGEGGLEKLKGDHEGWVITPEIRQAILDIWLPNFWLGAAQVRERLVTDGHIARLEEISVSSIYQVAEESGFAEVRRVLHQMFEFTAEGPQWREGVLVERLFELNERLMAQLQAQGALTPQLILEVEALKQAAGAPLTPLEKPLPWAYRLQQALFGQWQEIDDGRVRCPHCGSAHVRRKEDAPRRKKYYDPTTAEWHEAIGHRYFCLNPACPWGTFTDDPDGVHLYACWTADTVIWGVMVYMRMRTSYRLAADAVGVSSVTLWRWAMRLGQQGLPVAALFGVVRSSGVVGFDEKWVLVPKNNKPEGERKRWMYVYLAVDAFTYDLLHIDIYPYNGKDEARAFLQALKAKGYSPTVILTDMNQDYTEPIRQVFPHAIHHECVFHALQWAQRLIKEVYGNDYVQTHPEALELKEQLYAIFKAKTKKTVDKRYRQVMALQPDYVSAMPEAQRIFDFLEHHYPKLVNAVENPLIPLTNNTIELVIRRFDQHYQNFAGFDHIETARRYLNLFELAYRFTPFVDDNKPVKGRDLDIRGKCPLELAGYDISHMPLARILRERLLACPPEIQQELVPNA